ncbi:MAG: limonene,2-epoxide hydrolase [Alphaproteobacteria bacterium]|nr:limonene,2-epoxide hydrolase [Alphaproteobacteria bacterium]
MTVEETLNKKLMLSVVAGLKDGNLDPLFAALHPDIVWTATAPKAFFRFGGTHRGIAGMKEYTALLFSRYSFIAFEPRSVVTSGDQVWGLFAFEARHIPTGRIVATDISMRWTVKAGKIIAHQGFFDTAGVLMQQGELTVAA